VVVEQHLHNPAHMWVRLAASTHQQECMLDASLLVK
jgi:hypothetical protein